MSSIEELNKVLTQLCDDMAESTILIENSQLNPVRENIRKVGAAIFELSELRSEIYKIRPDLKPARWDQPPSEEAYGEMYEKALSMVKEYLDQEMLEKAIETLESYIFISPHEVYEKKARVKIRELQNEHGL